jgi:predicted ATPase
LRAARLESQGLFRPKTPRPRRFSAAQPRQRLGRTRAPRPAGIGRIQRGELLAALLEDAVELRPLKRLIIERTGGNPFFIEEMLQALFDERILVRNGLVKVTRSLSQIRIPPTVQGILAARIDRLSARPDQASCLHGVRSERMLAELRAAEFIYEQPALADTEYIFKHALTQEVAYNSLLIERRKQLHERTGQALE